MFPVLLQQLSPFIHLINSSHKWQRPEATWSVKLASGTRAFLTFIRKGATVNLSLDPDDRGAWPPGITIPAAGLASRYTSGVGVNMFLYGGTTLGYLGTDLSRPPKLRTGGDPVEGMEHRPLSQAVMEEAISSPYILHLRGRGVNSIVNHWRPLPLPRAPGTRDIHCRV